DMYFAPSRPPGGLNNAHSHEGSTGVSIRRIQEEGFKKIWYSSAPRLSSRVFWPVARAAQLTSFYVVASCGLLPRTTRPGPRVRTAYPAVAILPLRDTDSSSRAARRAGPVGNRAPASRGPGRLHLGRHGADRQEPWPR